MGFPHFDEKVVAAAFDAAAVPPGPVRIHDQVIARGAAGTLAALRRDLHELECLADSARAEGALSAAVLYENDAAEVEALIDALDPEEVSA